MSRARPGRREPHLSGDILCLRKPEADRLQVLARSGTAWNRQQTPVPGHVRAMAFANGVTCTSGSACSPVEAIQVPVFATSATWRRMPRRTRSIGPRDDSPVTETSARSRSWRTGSRNSDSLRSAVADALGVTRARLPGPPGPPTPGPSGPDRGGADAAQGSGGRGARAALPFPSRRESRGAQRSPEP
jgi:hypothetical protein